MEKWKLLAYHLGDLRVPLVVRAPQVRNPCCRHYQTDVMAVWQSFISSRRLLMLHEVPPGYERRRSWHLPLHLHSLKVTVWSQWNHPGSSNVPIAVLPPIYEQQIFNLLSCFFDAYFPDRTNGESESMICWQLRYAEADHLIFCCSFRKIWPTQTCRYAARHPCDCDKCSSAHCGDAQTRSRRPSKDGGAKCDFGPFYPTWPELTYGKTATVLGQANNQTALLLKGAFPCRLFRPSVLSCILNWSLWVCARLKSGDKFAVLPTLRLSREFGLVFIWSCRFFRRLAGCLFLGLIWLTLGCFLGLLFADFCFVDCIFSNFMALFLF